VSPHRFVESGEWQVASDKSINRLPVTAHRLRGRSDTDEQGKAGVAFVGDAMKDAGRRPNDFVCSSRYYFVAKLETASTT
jgi:hypothetical protein